MSAKRALGRTFALLGLLWMVIAAFTPTPMLSFALGILLFSIGVPMAYNSPTS